MKKLLPYTKDGTEHFQFMIEMSGFVQLLSSGANTILTLEGQNTTCADVFYAWVCIAYHLENVLASPTIGVNHLWGEVIAIYNHHFNQMMTESSYNLLLLAYYLHPSKFWYNFVCLSQLLFFIFLVFHHHGGLQLLSCDATWEIIDGVYPELKSEQDEYRLEVYFRETELE